MIIANPIFDVVFKRLMEDERVAKFFISTLLDETIVSLELRPQEFTYTDELIGVRVFRLDFIAVIKTEDGTHKKVLIEIQKAKHKTDLMRFRNYLAEQYKKEDTIDGVRKILPITTIYILGFNLPEIESACIKVERHYKDLINGGILGVKSDFAESLTHDSYVVQVNRITDRYKSRLDRLLSIFEQAHFVNDNEVIKQFRHKPQGADMNLVTSILVHSGSDSKLRKEIETEQEAWRTIEEYMRDKKIAYEETAKKLEQATEELEQATEELEQSKEELEQSKEELEQSKEKLEQKSEELEQSKEQLEQSKEELEQKDRLIQELREKLKRK